MPTDADTEAGRGEGLDDGPKEAFREAKRALNSLYRAAKAGRSGQPELVHEELQDHYDTVRQALHERMAMARRLRESDPGGQRSHYRGYRPEHWLEIARAELAKRAVKHTSDGRPNEAKKCREARSYLLTLLEHPAAPTDEAPEGNDGTWTRQECGACGVEAGKPCDYACPVEGCDCPTHAPPPVEEGERGDILERISGLPRREGIMDGVNRIAAERARQVHEEGWTAEHDDQHDRGELAMAAACCALSGTDAYPVGPDWRAETWMEELAEKHRGDEIRSLEIAGALIAAEIDRLLRREVPEARGRQ